jgi:hypothetical protein
MARSKRIHEALERLAAAERQFLAGEFLAPVLRGGPVQVRIAGLVCRFKVSPPDFEGWGVFKPTSATEAKLVRPARLAERQRYLGLFPLVRLILARRDDREWRAISAHRGDRRFRIEGMAPVLMVEEGRLYEVIEARFDGRQFWYASPDARRDPATGAYLRQSLEEMVEPEKLFRAGLTPEERAAYAVNYDARLAATEEGRRVLEERRLRGALAHAGARLEEWIERDDVYSVTYEVDGRRHVSVVAKDDLSVQLAGICLSGRDAEFDLQSLVSVLREAEGGGQE